MLSNIGFNCVSYNAIAGNSWEGFGNGQVVMNSGQHTTTEKSKVSVFLNRLADL